MRIVFDEVVGNVMGVESEGKPQAEEPQVDEEGGHSPQVRVDELERELRLRQRRRARLLAD